ncbi:MAG: AAA family ATPase [Actinomycetota bacterium]|nr:AAA family ATPase [Actinomycetota bacterium]
MRERKVVSVLFCDLVGFTAASESADPEEVEALIAPYHARTRERIEAYGGTVEKFIGDAVMAVFGAPTAHEDDPERAVRAGLAVLEAIEELNAADESLALSVRIGANTGEAVVLVDARPGLGEGMVTGDVVNTAARIQAQAPVNGVAVGEGTFRATERVFEYESLDPIVAKGKAEPVAVWRALRPTARFGSDVIRSMTTPLVGRALDFALLRGTFDKVIAERSVQLVTVAGEPGVGKSRLVAELFAYTDALDELITWRQGRCLPYGEGITLWALGEIVKAHAGVFESDPPDVATAKLDAVLPESADLPWLRARLLPLLGIDASESATQEELFTAWRRFLESVAERAPLVLVVEDIHWADPALLAFLEHLADWARGVPLLVVCTARPELYEARAAWGVGLRNHTAINLAPLSDTDTAKLVSVLLEQTVLPADTQQLLLERAGGNPLYAEEFVRMLRDRNLLDPYGALRGTAEVPFPESIHALIAARLDTLPQERKALLQDAAVLGKVFWAGAVSAMGDRDPHEVERALHELIRKELVRPSRQSSMEGEAEYGFWHLLIRDVAYQQIPRAGRAAKHLSAGEWLEAKAGERVEDLAEVLAYHTGEALSLAVATGDAALQTAVTPRAARYALLAGERALGLDATSALDLLERTKTLTAEQDPVFPLVLLRWAEAAREAGRLPEAGQALEQAIERFDGLGDVVHAGEALSRLSKVRWSLGEPDSITLAERAVTLLEPTPGRELVEALTRVASSQFVSGSYAAALETADRALALADQLDLAVPGDALGTRGLARTWLGDLGGLADTERALELLVAAGQGRGAATLQHNVACTRWCLEGPASAVAALEQAEMFSTGRGLLEHAQIHAASCALFLVDNGRLDDAAARAKSVLPLLRESGNRLFEHDVLVGQAVALDERGENALVPAERALELARGTHDAAYLAFASWAAAPALLTAGRVDEAKELLGAVADASGHDHGEYCHHLPRLARAAHALEDDDLLARLAAGVPDTLPRQQHALVTVRAIQAERAGEHAQAAALYADAADRWEQFTEMIEEAHALLGQGRCLTAVDDPGADLPLRQARALFAQMGARPRVDQCDNLIARASKLTS